MVDYWEEYKEMVFMVPFILVAILGQQALGSYFQVAFWASLVFLGGGMVGVPTAVDMQSRDLSPLVAEVYGPFTYGGSNNLQFMRDGLPKVKKLSEGRYAVVQKLKAPWVVHPKYGNIKNLRYFCEYPPSVLFTASKKVKISYKGSTPDNNHGDRAVLYEREAFNSHFRSEPQYEVEHATNTWAIKTKQLSARDIREAEEAVA